MRSECVCQHVRGTPSVGRPLDPEAMSSCLPKNFCFLLCCMVGLNYMIWHVRGLHWVWKPADARLFTWTRRLDTRAARKWPPQEFPVPCRHGVADFPTSFSRACGVVQTPRPWWSSAGRGAQHVPNHFAIKPIKQIKPFSYLWSRLRCICLYKRKGGGLAASIWAALSKNSPTWTSITKGGQVRSLCLDHGV